MFLTREGDVCPMAPPRRRVALLAAALLLLSLPVASAAEPSTVITITLEEDGDALWTVQNRVPLETDAEEQAFREVGGSEETTEALRADMERVVAAASNGTGREMALRNLSVDTRVEGVTRTWGVTAYTFRWTNFSLREDGTLRTAGHISSYNLAEGDRLTIQGPEGAEVESVSPLPDVQRDGSVSWRGPQSFSPDEPSLTLHLPAEPTPAPGDGGAPVLPILAAALLAAALLTAVYLRTRGETESDAEGGAGTDEGAEEPVEGPVPDADVVMELVRDAGGRMRQAEVGERTGWSASKVSKVTSRLEDEGRLLKRRWGKEKVLMLPDEKE